VIEAPSRSVNAHVAAPGSRSSPTPVKRAARFRENDHSRVVRTPG
jgi:hypothetical protein